MLKKFSLPVLIFSVFIFTRPIIESLWGIKYSSPLLSPLNWFGVLPLPFFLFYIYKHREKLKSFVTIDYLFISSGFLMIINAIVLLIFNPDVDSFSFAVRFAFIPLTYFFLVSSVNTTEDNQQLLKVFLAASSVPVLIFLYELSAGPINPYIPGGRGIIRYRGLYASGLNYLIYWSFALIVSAYFFLRDESKKILSPAFMIFLLLMAIITTGLFFLHQAAAYAIFAVLLLLILIFSYYKDKKKTAVVLAVLVLTFIIIGLMGVFERISVLYKLDYEIIRGQYPVEMGFNGRIEKWKYYINLFNQLPIHAKLFGASLSGIQFHATATATHNDFLRILFTTGIAGLMIHLFTLGYIFFRAFRLKRNERFLVIASLAFWVMLSVSQTPSFYIPVVYYFLVVVSSIRSELFLRKRESLATKSLSH